MSYIENTFMCMTRIYLLKKAKYHEDKFNELKDTKDIHLGNGKLKSDEYFEAQYEYMSIYADVCWAIGMMDTTDHFRKKLSIKLSENI